MASLDKRIDKPMQLRNVCRTLFSPLHDQHTGQSLLFSEKEKQNAIIYLVEKEKEKDKTTTSRVDVIRMRRRHSYGASVSQNIDWHGKSHAASSHHSAPFTPKCSSSATAPCTLPCPVCMRSSAVPFGRVQCHRLLPLSLQGTHPVSCYVKQQSKKWRVCAAKPFCTST